MFSVRELSVHFILMKMVNMCASAMNYHGSNQLLMADDSTTPEIDGFTSGDEIHWFYKDINGSFIKLKPVQLIFSF